jgi:hypothetical protein
MYSAPVSGRVCRFWPSGASWLSVMKVTPRRLSPWHSSDALNNRELQHASPGKIEQGTWWEARNAEDAALPAQVGRSLRAFLCNLWLAHT